MMAQGIHCTTGYGTERALLPRLAGLAGGLVLFAAFWGGVLDAAGVAPSGALSLLAEPGGAKLLLNQLFAASAARQAYVYQLLPGGGFAPLLPLVVLTGALCVFRAGRAALFLLFALGGAYLGITPGTGWLALLAAGLTLSFLRPPRQGWKGFSLAALFCALGLVALCAGVLTLAPGEDAALSAWEDGVRDTLALSTVAYEDAWTPPEPPEETPPPAAEEQPPEEGRLSQLLDQLAPTRRPVLLVILLLALALFVPSVWNDRLKKRRAESRAGLDDPDPAEGIRAALPYALRWLALAGLAADNVPFADYAPQIGQRFSPQLEADFRALLPLWQEAAWSEHPMSEEQRGRFRDFTEQAKAAAREKMGTGKQLLADYVYAL